MSRRITAGLLLMVFSVCCFAFLNRHTGGGEVFTFESSYKEEKVMLEATIWEKEGTEYAVLICPGYSCDRQKWQPFANVFAANGITVMTFDYAGQGASSGSIGFDNANTDEIPLEISHAITALKERTQLPDENIILLGHSMGGRAILRLLIDINRPGMETSVTPHSISNVILMSPEVNYIHSAQASLFAGTNDEAQEPWLSFSAEDAGSTRVFLYGSYADDVVSAGCINAIAERLGSSAETGIAKGILHSYQMYSPEFASFVNGALESITGKASCYNPYEQLLTYAGWLCALSGIFILLSGLNSRKQSANETLPVIPDAGKHLIKKLLLWLPGLVCAVLLCGICAFMPFGSPIMNIPYMCFIAGYGIVMLICLRRQLPKPSLRLKKGSAVTIAVTCAIIVYVWYILRSSMYRLIPMNARVIWLIICGALMTLGYYVSGAESDALRRQGASKRLLALNSLIQYIPLFLFVLFYLVIGSYSGLIGQTLNVLLMYILFIPLGRYVTQGTGSRFLGALVTGFSFQAFMITSAALIAMKF